MTEYEKMMANELYYSADPELVKLRKKAKELCQKYNTTPYENTEERKMIINDLIPSNKGNFCIEPNFYCDYGINISIGNWFYANHNLVILDCCKIDIGDEVLIGPNVSILGATHPLDSKMRNSSMEYGKNIKIGNNVWIGGNVVILPGVTIGDNAVIGAGAVVTKDCEANSVYVGNPARKVRSIDE